MSRRRLNESPPARVLFATAACAALGMLAWGLFRLLGPERNDPNNPTMHSFPGVTGPEGETTVPAPVPADWRDFENGEASRLAILLTEEDSDWLGLAHGLRSIGLPFRITRDAGAATRHRVVLVYPTISGRALSPEALRLLARHPEDGGTLIGFGIEGGGLEAVFGFSQGEASREHRELRLTEEPILAEFTDAAERELPVNSSVEGSTVTLLSFAPTQGRPLANYEDGKAGVLHRPVGSGHAYAFGFDLGHLALKGFNDRQEGLARSYANQYAPVVDTWLRLLARIYREGEPAGVLVHPAPEGRPLSVILTHDVDYTRSLENALKYVALERAQGVAATYFVQAKYVKDWNDDIFMNNAAGPILRELHAAGAEIASHSVSHSRVFEKFPLGTGRERYPDYRPFVTGLWGAVNGSILGELRVSRFLLELAVPDARVRSFRPGHLRNPFMLPQALQGAGYRYNSAASANNSLTHLPFRLTHGREKMAPVDVYEFPVTIEDELPPVLPQRLEEALGVAERIGRYGGLYVVLIHTDTVEEKLEFQRRLTAALQQRGAWFGRMDEFGPWWAARDGLEVDAKVESSGKLLVNINASSPVRGVGLHLPAGRWQAVSPAVSFTSDGTIAVVDVEGEMVLEFRR